MNDVAQDTALRASFAEMTPRYVRGPGQSITALSVPAEHQGALVGYSRMIRTRYSDGQIGMLAWRQLGMVNSIQVPDAPHPAGSSSARKLDTAVNFYAYSATANSRAVWVEFEF